MPLRGPAPRLLPVAVAQPTSKEGHPITLQVLDKIKQAEQEVEAILRKARETSDATVNKARQDAHRHLRNAEETARQRYEETIQAARTQVARETAEFAKQADTEVETVRRAFEGRLGEARERIVQVFERAVDAQD